MPPAELLQFCVRLMQTADMAFLTTLGDDGYPHTRAMFNLRNPSWFPNQEAVFAPHDRDLMLVLTTNASSAKVRHLRRDPRMAVYFCHPTRYEGLLLTGDGELCDSPEVRRAIWNEGWERYYPGGAEDPDHMAIRLFPRRAEGWRDSARFEFDFDRG
jgi:general stress protein 26